MPLLHFAAVSLEMHMILGLRSGTDDITCSADTRVGGIQGPMMGQ